MRPDPPKVLYAIAGTLAAQVMPQVGTPFGQQSTGLAATLSGLLAQEFDRAASRLVEENNAVIGILHAALPLVGDANLGLQLTAAVAQPPPTDFHVSALQARNDELRGLLIEVHRLVESEPGEAAELLNARIWDELRESTRRRHLATLQ